MEGKTKANAAKEKENKDRSSKMVIVKNLIEKGKKQGSLTLAEIMEAFSETELDKDQVENLYETLGNLGIEVIENKTDMAITSAYKALGIAAAIAFGVLLSSSFSSSLNNFKARNQRRTDFTNIRRKKWKKYT